MNWLEALTLSKEQSVTAIDIADTVGGGALENEVVQHARSLLINNARECVISEREFSLGSDLEQCCGGRVRLQFDCHWADEFTLHVFGAGHVAQEVCRIAQRLPISTTFHDARASWLQEIEETALNSSATRKLSVQRIKTATLPADIFTYIESFEQCAYYLIMTHSHELDMELVEAVLSKKDARYCGLIASKSKAARFKNRLERKGFSKDEINALTAPLGVHIDTGNTPMEVAQT